MPPRPAPLTINGVNLAEHLRIDLHGVVDVVLARILEDVDLYREMPAEVITGDIRAVIYDNLRLVRDAIIQQRPPGPEVLGQIADSAFRRAEEGIPLEMVVSAYFAAAHQAWQDITADAGPEDVGDLRTVTDLMLAYLRVALTTVSTAYLEEMRMSYTEEQSARTSLVAALLAGGAVEDHALTAGIELPAGYAVLALRVGPHPDEQGPAVGASIAARRKVRRIRTELAGFVGSPPLMLLEATGGTVLVPAPDGLAPLVPAVRRLVERLTDVAGAEVTVGLAHGSPSGVAEAARRAKEVLDVVRVTRRPPGLYRLEDLLLDYQLSRTTAATATLAAMLDPLRENVDLLPTLEAHLANELNRKATAAALSVHPNTVDYRIRRIATLTGLDATLPSHLQVLGAALAARAALSGS